MTASRTGVPALSEELAEAKLGDVRLNRRLSSLGERLAGHSGESFPKALDDAELEAAYRFFGNNRVAPEEILAPHSRESARRAGELPQVLVIHDTTVFEFSGQTKRKGLGHLIRPTAQGFFGHFSLAVTADGERRPLGLLALETIFRLKRRVGHSNWSPDKSLGESARWVRGLEASELQLQGRVQSIHVTDREGDQYALLEALLTGKRRFVIRSFQDRRLAGDDQARLRAVASAARVTLRREVPLSPRPKIEGPKGERHSARRHRMARLSFAATTVDLRCPTDVSRAGPPSLRVNVIHVFEPKPPPGECPVEWFLLTNLPIDSEDEIAFVVDCYRARWTIEEYFKALKTGCLFEKRQLESAHSLLNALAIFAPVAWRLLLLRHLARSRHRTPATDALTQYQLGVLRAVAKKPLPSRPSTRDVMLAIAALGGHIKSNGDPGWLVLGRGLHDLLLLELGWRLRQEAEK
jgi:hypothetical protein